MTPESPTAKVAPSHKHPLTATTLKELCQTADCRAPQPVVALVATSSMRAAANETAPREKKVRSGRVDSKTNMAGRNILTSTTKEGT